MSATIQHQSSSAWGETQIDAKPAGMDLLLAHPATRLFYRASRADYPSCRCRLTSKSICRTVSNGFPWFERRVSGPK